ncbi:MULTISPECIES: DUF6798 domain-containing protein [unclassified Coleofasciculus]|uniref:DUF6798 domain-containing protein n=1 Tax=unclassified Coleofasciculus TaxID=2692782 RepID=UPI00187FF4E5|nr:MULTISPECIES: DUF6798 domain-containing protein [unclassified Coleofasciculus]MBE9125751.1 hypothetical protein [Coleofasciculus sp. LEGE 07081]MBE9147239.1 hypothetical protein [Coleofasciculus sp. LEGE 07092]
MSSYKIYHENQAIQLPLVHWLNNPSLYSNDPFAATLRYYSSMLWMLVALLANFIPLEPLLLILFLIERLLLLYAAGYLAQTFAPKSKLAVIGAMALFALAPDSILGSGTLVESYFEQTGLFIPFFLLAAASFYSRHSIAWAIWLSLGFNLNSMYGVYSLTYFSALFCIDSTYWRGWKRWGGALVLFFFLASPAILVTFSAFSKNAVNSNLWRLASKVRFAHHLYPLTWSLIDFTKFGILVGVLLGYLYYSRDLFNRLFKHSLVWTGMSLLWLLYAFAAAYITKSPSMLVMHPARATDLWYCIAAISLISVSAARFERNGTRTTFLGVAVIFSILVSLLTNIIPPLNSIRFYINLAVPGIAIAAIIFWRLLRSYVFSKKNFQYLALLLTFWVLLVGMGDFSRRFKIDKRFLSAMIERPNSEIEQIANWASKNTPVDAVFLVDPNSESSQHRGWEHFRTLAKRSVFVTWKDGSAILWDRTYVEAWMNRLQALGFDLSQLQKPLNETEFLENLNLAYRNLRDDDIKKLKQEFPLHYWVVPLNQPSLFPVVFQSRHYKVLTLQSI